MNTPQEGDPITVNPIDLWFDKIREELGSRLISVEIERSEALDTADPSRFKLTREFEVLQARDAHLFELAALITADTTQTALALTHYQAELAAVIHGQRAVAEAIEKENLEQVTRLVISAAIGTEEAITIAKFEDTSALLNILQ